MPSFAAKAKVGGTLIQVYTRRYEKLNGERERERTFTTSPKAKDRRGA